MIFSASGTRIAKRFHQAQRSPLLFVEDQTMARGDKSKYSDKQKRKAEHIEEGYEKRGVSAKEAKSRAWATVNKESGGGKKSGSGRGKTESHASSRKGGRLGGAASSSRSAAQRSASAKKGAATRARNRNSAASSR
jgi:plasmid stabilization system protein ParE